MNDEDLLTLNAYERIIAVRSTHTRCPQSSPARAIHRRRRTEMSFRVKHLASLLCAVAVATLAAGCSATRTSPAGVPQTMPAMNQTQASASNMDRRGCQDDDGVNVRPCQIVFTASHPGPDTVTVDSNGKLVVERDDCTQRGVASIAPAGRNTYTVTAGTTAGVCAARFVVRNQRHNDDHGNQNGAILTVVNHL